jgi:putative nucleotidyltransferase with HDIG domain
MLPDCIKITSNIIKYHDPMTYEHTVRVAELAKQLAGSFDVDPMIVYCGALVHDIGKILIPKEIIYKPGKLTVEEYQLIKQHAVFGGQMFDDIDGMVKNIILGHHEHVDGSGYPSGGIVPLEVQIVTVADVYDAILSKRHYKDASSRECALDELIAKSSIWYNKEVVNKLVEITDV